MIQTFPNGSTITAEEIIIGKNFTVGKNVHIQCRGTFEVGDYSRFGDNVDINAHSVKIGDHFFHYTPGLRVGGGGSNEGAALFVGHRCVMHNNYINLANEVVIHDDVGLSPEVQILTHGFWESILEGFPYKNANVQIWSNTIIGQRAMILPGVLIGECNIIGAGAVVAKSIFGMYEIWGGNPARKLRNVEPLSDEQQRYIATMLVKGFKAPVKFEFPIAEVDGCTFNLLTKTKLGVETPLTDDFRDHLRRYGIKIYTTRPFGRAH